MEVSTERQDSVLSVRVVGRIDGTNVREFEESVRGAIEQTDRAVILDFKAITYISSAGLRALLLTAKAMRTQNSEFSLCSVSDEIREIFEISGFDRIITIHDTKEAALKAVEG